MLASCRAAREVALDFAGSSELEQVLEADPALGQESAVWSVGTLEEAVDVVLQVEFLLDRGAAEVGRVH
eukprot:1123736-Prymnesium_polylepis.1